ncbi:hypothetical protein C7E16_11705 [Acinetobacter radioresistens]|uniref:OB-fold-containig protein n=1 Tax=Acinetobacter radioresistens TaxID=40216 RepID=UPI000D0AEE2F|nr:OB-fold-containig protein [Acinetobacter radioresistens]PSD35192.1 hypothetical protein C7E16_11705 [Acinetobacter radioresistens]
MAALLLNYYLMPFNVSLLALVLLSMAETIGMQFGFRPSDLLKRFIPVWISNSPLFDVKFSKVLIFVFLLMNFSFAGYFLQFVYFANQQQLISPFYIILPALIIAIFFTMFMIHCLDQVIKPKLNQKNTSLLGRLATISSGSARPGFSAQARVRDEFGQLHYVQVEPEFGKLEFQSQVILIRFKKSHYRAKKISESNRLFNPEL